MFFQNNYFVQQVLKNFSVQGGRIKKRESESENQKRKRGREMGKEGDRELFDNLCI